jgi:hypothetical protein
MTRATTLALAATFALVASHGASAAEATSTPTACPVDRKALVALLKPLKREHKWDDPDEPNPDARHYKPGALRMLGLAPVDVFVLYRDAGPESVSFRFSMRDLQTLTPAYQAAYPAARCSSPQGCGLDPRSSNPGGGKSRSGDLVFAGIEAGDSEYLGATLTCRYLW